MSAQSAVDAINNALTNSSDRESFWSKVLLKSQAAEVAEVGVWRGEFSERILHDCPGIRNYYLVDSWRNLPNWNKPFNVPDEEFERVMEEALNRTSFATDRRHVLRGTTLQVAESLPEKGLDVCYIDGDHTLRGITIDLLAMYAKTRDGGILGGDDFSPSAWQHGMRFEPTMVFPYAVYFAEATGSVIYGLPYNQFALVVDRSNRAFDFRDCSGRYGDLTVRGLMRSIRKKSLKQMVLKFLGR